MKFPKTIVLLLTVCAAAAFAAEQSAPKKPAHKTAASAAKMADGRPRRHEVGRCASSISAGREARRPRGKSVRTGYFTVALKMPDGYKIMPHWHPRTERVTVISGEFHAGMGDKIGRKRCEDVSARELHLDPDRACTTTLSRRARRSSRSSGPAPFQLTYVNPADDPSGMQGKKKAAPKKAEAKTGA